MDYKKLGTFLIIGLVVSLTLSVVFKDATLSELSGRLFITELAEVIVWCFMGEKK